jgi:hypothetical protein
MQAVANNSTGAQIVPDQMPVQNNKASTGGTKKPAEAKTATGKKTGYTQWE